MAETAGTIAPVCFCART